LRAPSRASSAIPWKRATPCTIARAALTRQIEDELVLQREGIALDDAIRKVEATMPAAKPSAPDKNALTGFRNPTSLTRALQFLLATLLVLSIAALWSNMAQYQLLQSPFTQAEGAANDLRQGIIGGIYFVSIIATMAVFGCWIYRANGNARALGAVRQAVQPRLVCRLVFRPVRLLVETVSGHAGNLQGEQKSLTLAKRAYRSHPRLVVVRLDHQQHYGAGRFQTDDGRARRAVSIGSLGIWYR
jgi:hypothetical protein